MSKHDTMDRNDLPVENHTNINSPEQFDYEAFRVFFEDAPPSQTEFEDSGVLDYVPPAEGMTLPDLDEDSDYIGSGSHSTEPEPQVQPFDGGVYRSNDGTSEFCSFDEVAPDAIPDGWHHEGSPVIDNLLSETAPEEERAPSEDELPDQYEPEETHEDDPEDDEIPLKHPVLHTLGNVMLGFITFISLVYLVGVYSKNPIITKARNMYIQTAMSTLNHKWLATAIIPPDTIEDLMRLNYESETVLVGRESNWGDVNVQALPRFENATTELTGGVTQDANVDPSITEVLETDSVLENLYSTPEEQTFFELFYEVDYRSMHSYVDAHPEVIANGWENININAAGLDDEGTEIKTIYGDQVLAINAQEGVILIRLDISLSRGVMAICKDTSKLSLCAADTLGSIGQTAGRICEANNGIVSVTASGFVDPDGAGNGGELSGLAVCSGTYYGTSLGGGYKRLELRDDGHMYVVDSSSPVSDGTRDAAEFTPALIIDGEVVVDENSFWTSPNPRTCVGQTAYLETVMVVIEGRFTDSPGCSVVPVAEKMHQYGCVQALNMDGGTSAIMYYDGEYVTRCSNVNLPGGRTLPTAWVYRRNS